MARSTILEKYRAGQVQTREIAEHNTIKPAAEGKTRAKKIDAHVVDLLSAPHKPLGAGKGCHPLRDKANVGGKLEGLKTGPSRRMRFFTPQQDPSLGKKAGRVDNKEAKDLPV